MGKKIHIELLRVLAIIFVIFNHLDCYYVYFTNTDNFFTYWFSLIGSIVCRINVPLFFLISGALLLNKEESIEENLKRIQHFAKVLLIFSLIQYIFDGIRGKGQLLPKDFIVRLFSGDISETYWFLYTYIGILFIIPIIRKLIGSINDTEYRYIFFLQLIVSLIIPVIEGLFGVKIYNFIFYANIYLYYIILGNYLENFNIQKIKTIKIIAICITCIITGIILIQVNYAINEEYPERALDYVIPILAPSVYILVKKICNKYNFTVQMRKIILCIGGCTFGIYLIEKMVRVQLLPIYLYLAEETIGVFACLVYLFATFGVSFLYIFS